jgi:membrane-associated phospholipid phosphatase
MDPVTAWALSIHNSFIRETGLLLDQIFMYALVIIGLVLLGERKNDKRIKIFLTLAFSYLLGLAIKYLIAEPRPCFGADWCPLSYAFPSTHAVVAFTLMFCFMKKKSFPFFLVFAIFVSFTRLNVGVHVFGDIIGAIPVAFFAYYAIDGVWTWLEQRNWLKNTGMPKKQ